MAVWLLVGCASPESSSPPPSAAPAPSTSPGAAAEGSGVDAGFIVWESNRSGNWRLWISDLAGGKARQLTPDESGRRSHCCPHIAPDGARVAYLSLPAGRARYLDEDAVGELRAIAPAGGAPRRLAERARTYFEHRAVVWVDGERLHFIDGDGAVRRLDVDSGESSLVLAATGDMSRRWLVDATSRWAATGRGALAPVVGGRLGPETPLPGCQPYFSHDGRWGLWTAGAGGPIDRFDLASGEAETILRKNDPRLPAGRGYLYFPMLSRDGSLLAFAASDGEHDHHRADYDIFAAEIDPESLEILGVPWPVAPDPAVDRFPDIWRRDPPPPRTGEAAPRASEPLRQRWPARTDGLLWSWSAAAGAPTTPLRQAGELLAPGRLLDLGAAAVTASDTAVTLHEGLQRTNQFTLELVLTPPPRTIAAPKVILSIGRDSARDNLTLLQRSDRLVLRMRVGPKGRDSHAEADLGPLPASRRLHLAIAYSPGRTTVFRDGERVLQSRELRGHFFQWRPYPLTLGDYGRGGAAWVGRIEALAIYDRPVSESEIRANAGLTAGGT